MASIPLAPKQERFAAEAVVSGRYPDMSAVVAAGVDLLQRAEAVRAALLASVTAARDEGDRIGFLTADDPLARVEARLGELRSPAA